MIYTAEEKHSCYLLFICLSIYLRLHEKREFKNGQKQSHKSTLFTSIVLMTVDLFLGLFLMSQGDCVVKV